MNVVLCVAGAADHGGLCDGLRFDVALPAADVRVGARQRKPGARRMIEVPELPAVGRVACAAVLAQLSLVDVLFRVAADAGLWCFLEVLILVTLAARGGDVETEKRVGREVVVEGDVAPFRGGVTCLAGFPQRAAMRVVGAMTAAAICPELLLFDDTRVAGVTVKPGVRIFEWEKRLVIVGGDLPDVVAMTVAAGGAQPARVTIVRLVAAGTVFRDRVFEVAAAMTVGAADVSVSAEQGEAGLAGVLKLPGAPVGGRMAVAALFSLGSLVDVVWRMTGDAFFGRALVALPGMTGGAGGLRVLVGQWERCFVVIEVRLLPGLRVMTGAAIRPNALWCASSFLMAADAGVGGLAERHMSARGSCRRSERRASPSSAKFARSCVKPGWLSLVISASRPWCSEWQPLHSPVPDAGMRP